MFRKGDTVRILLPQNDLTVKSNIRQFNGKVTTITKVITKGSHPQFYLDGCKSKFDKDYVFLAEWLKPADDEPKKGQDNG